MLGGRQSKAGKLLATSFYEGNEWDRILGSEEYRILFYLFRFLALIVDKVMGVKYSPEEK